MGTDVILSFNSLRAQLENAKNSLHKIDENIKKVVQTTGRYQSGDRNNPETNRGGLRFNRNTNFPDANYKTEEEKSIKRKHETKIVFSRLSVRENTIDNEENGFNKRPRISSQVIRDLPSKQDVLKAQGGDEVSKARNRRMFGSLLGTLQKFKQEEIILKSKEDKKAQIEKKIEEQATKERENQKKERQNLFAEREMKIATIKALETKMMRVQEFEKWENIQRPLGLFIFTKAKPPICWLPKKMSVKAQEKQDACRKSHDKFIIKKRDDLDMELKRIEEKFLHKSRANPAIQWTTSELEDKTQNCDNYDDNIKQREKFINHIETVRADDSDLTVAKPPSIKEEKINNECPIVLEKEEKMETDDTSQHSNEQPKATEPDENSEISTLVLRNGDSNEQPGEQEVPNENKEPC